MKGWFEMGEKRAVKDLDLKITVRSSQMLIQDLTKITTLIVETLAQSCEVDLVDQNTNISQNVDRKLITITSTFQSKDKTQD